MRVAWYLDSQDPKYLWFLGKSLCRVRKLMPQAETVFLTVHDFPCQEFGFDRVERFKERSDWFYGHKKCAAQASLDGDVLFLDVDCIVQKDVSHVFDTPFDIALCIRYKSKAIDKLPFNGGVAFSRSQQFWKDVAGGHGDHRHGADTENRFSAVAMSDRYVVRALNGDIYNYSPFNQGEDLSMRSIVHYKGHRKDGLYTGPTSDTGH